MNDAEVDQAKRVALRAHADALVRTEDTEAIEALTPLEIKSIVHELQVHRLELEAQNEEVRCAHAKLERSRERYLDLYEHAPVGYLSLSEAGEVVAANLTSATLFGVPRGALLRTRLADRVLPPDQDTYFRERRALFEQGAARTFELRLLRPDGSHFWGRFSATVDGGRSVAQLALSDVTELRAAQDTLGSVDRLESLGTLAAGIAHDFNNVLTGVRGNLSLLEELTRSDQHARELVAEAHDACGAAVDLARQLLTFAKGGAPSLQIVDLRQIVRQASIFAARGSHCVCVCDFEEQPVRARVDPNQIGLVVQNLVLNAIQAMPKGGQISLRLRKRRIPADDPPALISGEYAELTVQDQGAGIPEQDLPRIFDPYFSTKTGGHGLGLTMVFSVVGRHLGQVRAGNAPTGGAEFTVRLPLTAAAPEVASASIPTAVPTPGRKILIVDDEPVVVAVLTRILLSLGHEVEATADGKLALEMWRNALGSARPFQVAITDLTIPGGMGGRAAVTELLKVDPSACVIACSGYSSDDVMSNAARYGFRGVLPKPFARAEVAAALNAALESK